MKQQKKNAKTRTKKSRVVRVPEGKPPLVPQYRKSGSKEVTAEFKAGKDLEA
jgi:hypothetical protein